MCAFLASVFAFLFFSASAFAGDHGFETTSQGMIESLAPKSVPGEAPRTRSWTPVAPQGRAIKVVKKDEGKTVEEWVPVHEAGAGPSINLKIEFDVNSYRIRRDSIKLLDELGKALTSDRLRQKTFLIKGHTDSDGSDAYNLTLSMNRAQAVKEYLTGNFRIQAERLKAVGYGEGMPLVPNTSAETKQLNRRVEVETAP